MDVIEVFRATWSNGKQECWAHVSVHVFNVSYELQDDTSGMYLSLVYIS